MPDHQRIAANYATALASATEFFMGEADVQKAARRLSKALTDLGIAHAIVGGLAVAAHGHLRVTVDVDVLLTADGLAKFKEQWLGRGWVEQFAGSRGLRDTTCNVKIDVLLTGGHPGDGKPKPVAFPDPAAVSIDVAGTPIVALETLLELKLASGMSAPDRLQDLADVIALIRANRLAADFAEQLDGSVRAKYRELWSHAQIRRDEG